jgi:predicted N-formylglutamate amidohydrolase
VIEIPHGATRTSDFTSLAARLTSPLPEGLVDFFHVNTDAGAPELAVATAHHLVAAAPSRTVAILRCQIPRTFIDCNRRVEATPEDFKAGKVTPGLMPWITSPDDRALLRAAYDRYVAQVREATTRLATDGAMVMLHSYAPRTVDVEVDLAIVQSLRAAYQPAVEPTWPLRPELDVIGKTVDGTDHAPAGVVEALRRGMAAHHLTVAEGATYPLHPSTLAYDHVMARPGRALCLEVRRDLLADPFEPFVQMRISPENVGRLAVPLAAALRCWW